MGSEPRSGSYLGGQVFVRYVQQELARRVARGQDAGSGPPDEVVEAAERLEAALVQAVRHNYLRNAWYFYMNRRDVEKVVDYISQIRKP